MAKKIENDHTPESKFPHIHAVFRSAPYGSVPLLWEFLDTPPVLVYWCVRIVRNFTVRFSWSCKSAGITRIHYGVFTLSDTKNENDNYGFHLICRALHTAPRQMTTQILIEFCILIIGLGIGLILGVVQCEYTIKTSIFVLLSGISRV